MERLAASTFFCFALGAPTSTEDEPFEPETWASTFSGLTAAGGPAALGSVVTSAPAPRLLASTDAAVAAPATATAVRVDIVLILCLRTERSSEPFDPRPRATPALTLPVSAASRGPNAEVERERADSAAAASAAMAARRGEGAAARSSAAIASRRGDGETAVWGCRIGLFGACPRESRDDRRLCRSRRRTGSGVAEDDSDITLQVCR